MRAIYSKYLIRVLGLTLTLFASTHLRAEVTIDVPGWGQDDGTELFQPAADLVISIQIADLLNFLQPGDGFEFGIYRVSAPDQLIALFDASDAIVEGSDEYQVAILDFATGYILDYDATVIQSQFEPGYEPFGLYLKSRGRIFYSQSTLNQDGVNVAVTLPSTTSSKPFGYLIGFEVGDASSSGLLLGLIQFGGIEPAPAGLGYQ